MNQKNYIKSYIHIKKNTVYLNGKLFYSDQSIDFKSFIKEFYNFSKTKYPKFFKMDSLSKLAFIAGDIILKNEKLSIEKENNIALVFSNRASSLDTDRKYQESIQFKESYYPSPSVFVYTLPNICIGEISIKHKLYSENSFFIFDKFNASHLEVYSSCLLADNKADKVLCGWVEFDGENSYEAFLYLVSKEGEILHNTEEIIKLYTN